MNNAKRLKKQFKDKYSFEKYLPDESIRNILKNQVQLDSDIVLASLRVNYIRLDLVCYQNENGLNISYDVFVKDNPENIEWICFDSVLCSNKIKLSNLEKQMVNFLNKEIDYYNLSYSECYYETINPKGDQK